MPTLRKNLFYSILLVLANYVFPFLTYPYVSRVLGVTGIGACNFVDSVINYFILFSMLGIEAVGTREIAKSKQDQERLNQVFSNLILVSMALTGIMLLALLVLTFTVPVLMAHKEMMLFGAFKLVFNCFLMEWLFKGLEDFRLITVRTIAVKTLYVVSVFVLVKKAEDVGVYYMLCCLIVVLNAFVNMFISRKRVRVTFKNLHLIPTFKAVLTLGFYTILTSMYTSFNTTFLGFVAGDVQVGYYSTATKLYSIVMALFTAFTGVMIPKLSTIVAEGDINRLKKYFHQVVELLLALTIPLVAWMIIMAPDIISLISGPGYEGAILPMIVIAPLVFIIGYEQILVLQTLLPLGKDSIMLRNSAIGAFVGVILNILFVPKLLAVGSACIWVVCEMLILLLSQKAVSLAIGGVFPYKAAFKTILECLPLVAFLFLCSRAGDSVMLRLLLSVCIVTSYVFLVQLLIEKRNLLKMLSHQ